jgi:hypothetical protein
MVTRRELGRKFKLEAVNLVMVHGEVLTPLMMAV